MQQEAISNAYAERDAIKSLIANGIAKHLEALQNVIDKYKEMLNASKDAYEYSKNIGEQVDNINKLQKLINAYAGDDSEENRLRIQDYTNQIEDAQQQLQETEWDRYISETGKMLDDLYEDYSETLNARLDDIDGLLEWIRNNTDPQNLQDAINELGDRWGYDPTITNEDGSVKSTNSILEEILETIKNMIVNPIDGNNTPNENPDNPGEAPQNPNSVPNNNDFYKRGEQDIAYYSGGNLYSGTILSPNADGSQLLVETDGQQYWINADQMAGYLNEAEKIVALDSDGIPHKGYWFGNVNGYDRVYLDNGYGGYLEDKNVFRAGDKISTGGSNGVLKGYIEDGDNMYAHVVLENGYDGVVNWNELDVENGISKNNKKYNNLKKFAKGGRKITDDLVITNEDGAELIRTNDGSILTPLGEGSNGMVFNNDMSNALYDFAKNPNAFIGNIVKDYPITVPKPKSINSISNDNKIAISLPGVTNYPEFKEALQKDDNFNRFIKQITIGEISGKNSLLKNKY